MSFSNFGFTDAILRGITASGYKTPTEIQQKAIPIALEGRDIIGCAPTGTGKTAAFVLPVLHQLSKTRVPAHIKRTPRALILTPTRELAQQIENSARAYGKFMDVRTLSIYGGVHIVNQLRCLNRSCDVAIATPGRLLDHMDRGSIDLSKVEILVLDEADRMYDMGFINDVRTIIASIPKERQTLLFSATMSREIKALIAGIQKNPHLIEIGDPFKPVDTVEQNFYVASQQTKMNLLTHILEDVTIKTMLVFSRTKEGADKIADHLYKCGIQTTAIHSNRTQSQRERALEGFKRNRFRVLVATDIAARGIDVNGITHVVNFDTPVYAEDYIHRIGRTGRAERTGIALTFVSEDERKYIRKIEYLTGKRFDVKRYPGFAYPERDLVAPRPRHFEPQRQQRSFNSHSPRFATAR